MGVCMATAASCHDTSHNNGFRVRAKSVVNDRLAASYRRHAAFQGAFEIRKPAIISDPVVTS